MAQDKIIKAPRGRERLKWLGPAFIWMLSAAGSGELLFTPRIACKPHCPNRQRHIVDQPINQPNSILKNLFAKAEKLVTFVQQC